MIKMNEDLTLIGMEKGRQYETIISTKNEDGSKNAAPIGVICASHDKIIIRIFKGSHTLDNIIREKEFIVNITHDPELYTTSTLGNLPQDYFEDDGSIKGINAFFKCEAIRLTEAVKQSDPIKKKDEAIVIKSKVTDMTVKEDVHALNRGFGYVIETLANYTRFDIVGDDQKEEYLKKFKEANRVVLKVGTKEDIKAMRIIKKELMKKGYEP